MNRSILMALIALNLAASSALAVPGRAAPARAANAKAAVTRLAAELGMRSQNDIDALTRRIESDADFAKIVSAKLKGREEATQAGNADMKAVIDGQLFLASKLSNDALLGDGPAQQGLEALVKMNVKDFKGEQLANLKELTIKTQDKVKAGQNSDVALRTSIEELITAGKLKGVTSADEFLKKMKELCKA